MKHEICKDENEWVNCANNWLLKQCAALSLVSDKQHAPNTIRLFLPAGETPRPLYRSWRENPQLITDQITFVQIDEILDTNRNTFRNFLLDELPMFNKRFEFIEAAERGADLAFLGLGLNGHVAFHEPGLPRDFYSGCLTLNRKTCEHLHRPAETHAVSYGVSAFLKARAIALLVRGSQKRDILKRVLDSRDQYPASWLLDHPQLTIISFES